MNIILLSGGSGKRLWPLSNNIRSKQFIPFFKNKDGFYESMVQRIYHSIKRINKDAKVLIATAENQIPLLKEQLGEDINISIEPARRETFPAIALAVGYMHEKMGVKEDESIIVLPVDPYAEDDYFEALKELDSLTNTNECKLSLIGVEPTEPTSKYGYIIPTTNEHVSFVESFKEKPDKAKAEEYIKEGALWSAGIYGFKVDYFLKKAEEMLEYKNYDSFLASYKDCPILSVSYALVEKEKSTKVIRFNGKWEDLGSWEVFTSLMEGDVFGKGIIHDSSNVKVVNETEIPIVVNGASNLIVAASKDGIYVSDISKSDEIKKII